MAFQVSDYVRHFVELLTTVKVRACLNTFEWEFLRLQGSFDQALASESSFVFRIVLR
jgi:hypothetical protein